MMENLLWQDLKWSGEWETEFGKSIYVPPVSIRDLGDPSFINDYGLKCAYVAGSMATGIASEDLVCALANDGFLAFFGAAGLSVSRVTQAIDEIRRRVDAKPFGFNLIHSPSEPQLEEAITDLYLAQGIHLIEASAFLKVNANLVRYRLHGIHRNEQGEIVTPNRIMAKISRPELARQFWSPPPVDIVNKLYEAGKLTAEQCELSQYIPLAQDVTCESDSGGHTDNRPAMPLFASLDSLRKEIQNKNNYLFPLRLGLAGGIGSPLAVHAAFSMGASYVVTGSINQSCIEAGTSNYVKQVLSEVKPHEVMMTACADMFEMGVKVQVLKSKTLFPMRAAKLYETYRSHSSLSEIPQRERLEIEEKILRASFEDVWRLTCDYFQAHDPSQISKGEANPKIKMALIFRWYIGQSSKWAITEQADRKMDYQVWCGPAMGSFNEWTRNSHLTEPEYRKVSLVAKNLLYGAGWHARHFTVRTQGYHPNGELVPQGPWDHEELDSFFT